MSLVDGSATPPGAGNTYGEEVWRQLDAETEAMARYALAAGIAIPPAIIQTIDHHKGNPNDRVALSSAHNQLAKLVAPAKPGTIRVLEDQKGGRFSHYLGPISLVRQLVVVALVFLIGFVLLATLTPAGSESTTPTTVARGWSSLSVVTYLFAAAGVGATFAALWRLNRYVDEGTYDRRYDSSYLIMIVLGLISGLVLAMVIPIDSVAGQKALSKPLLALLGGFSATAVHRILMRLVAAVESIVKGDPTDEAKAKDQQVAADRNADRTGIASRLVTVERALSNGGDVTEAKKQLDAVLASLLPENAAQPLAVVQPDAASANSGQNGGAGVVTV